MFQCHPGCGHSFGGPAALSNHQKFCRCSKQRLKIALAKEKERRAQALPLVPVHAMQVPPPPDTTPPPTELNGRSEAGLTARLVSTLFKLSLLVTESWSWSFMLTSWLHAGAIRKQKPAHSWPRRLSYCKPGTSAHVSTSRKMPKATSLSLS